jgi:hypothetical protein
VRRGAAQRLSIDFVRAYGDISVGHPHETDGRSAEER